jgi:CBS domain-containing protein
MAQFENPTGTLRRDEAVGLTVGDVMIPRPKTLAADARVGDVRRLLESRGVRTVLLAEDGAFRGAIERAALPGDAGDDEPAAAYADLEPLTVTPDMPMFEAIALLESSREPRLIVLDADGETLLGLVCAKPGATTFCVTSD